MAAPSENIFNGVKSYLDAEKMHCIREISNYNIVSKPVIFILFF